MNTSATVHLTGHESIDLYLGLEDANHVSLYVRGDNYAGDFGLCLGRINGDKANAAFLRRLATAASELADRCDTLATSQAVSL